MTKTPVCSWKRAFQKFSPSTDFLHSPIIPIQGKVKPTLVNDITLTTAIWGLTTHEEYYYQNFIELISRHKLSALKTNQILRLNRIPSYWSNRLINFRVLGSGSFGRVFQTSDAFTDETYALKEVSSYSKENGKLLKNTIMIMTERNAHFRANESPFVVKLHGAFQDSELMSYWLIFEYCVGDLQVYINYIRADIKQYLDRFLSEHILTELYDSYRKEIDLDIEKVALVFGFELLAGIDYLAKRNLLHNDLKPENVLVSARGHLKISDLGLTHRFRWLDRWSAVEFADPDLFKKHEERDKTSRFIGNFKFTDPEILIFFNLIMPASTIYSRFEHRKFPLRNIHQHFLTDLYGVALIMLELLFAGMNIITTRKFTKNIEKRFRINGQDQFELRIWPIRCTYDNNVKRNFLDKILDLQTTTKNKSVLQFLKTCFLPRADRAVDYTKIIDHMKLKEKSKTRCIDIEKIEEIDYYFTREFTEFNVTSMIMPQSLTNLFVKEPRPIFTKTFDELLEKIERRAADDKQELRMGPFEFVS